MIDGARGLAIRKIASYSVTVPRRTGLLPLELAILRIATAEQEVHGFGVARVLRDAHGAGLTAHGTLYKALSRLTSWGLLTARWEPADEAEQAGRPRRRLYRITAAGRAAVTVATAAATTADRPAAARRGAARPTGATGRRGQPQVAPQ